MFNANSSNTPLLTIRKEREYNATVKRLNELLDEIGDDEKHLLWKSFRLAHDLDDTRKNPYGEYYTRKKPLTLAALGNDSSEI